MDRSDRTARWQILARGAGGCQASLTGELTEAVDFAELQKQLHGPLVRLDLEGVRHLNSMGIREFTNLVAALRASSARVELEGCSAAVVNQLNMLPHLSKMVVVTSVHAPMECPKCGFEKGLLVHVGPGMSLAATCDKCHADMELGDVYDRYFAFLEDQVPR